MFVQLSAVLLFLASAVSASQDSIAGYEPGTDVAPHADLDLDQAALEAALGASDNELVFANARRVYEAGGHSKPYAELVLNDVLQVTVAKGTSLTGRTEGGATVTGKALEEAPANSAVLKFQYSDHESCRVGGLVEDDHVTRGCLVASGGSVTIGSSTTVTYAESTNLAGRTIQGFSTGAPGKLDGQPEFEKAVTYYGRRDYGDHWVDSALSGDLTTFPGKGNADFTLYGTVGRREAVKKGTAYIIVWMYVIHEMEDAIKDCRNKDLADNNDAVHAWDEAVAFYAGSLEETVIGGDPNGVFPYRLAEKRCRNFNTCLDENGDYTNDGVSQVNDHIITLFKQGKSALEVLDCDLAEELKGDIVRWMYIPLIQGTIRYAYITDRDDAACEKGEAEGATFAAGILPAIHACDEAAAQTIYDNMRVGFTMTNFIAVKEAFESTYRCLNINCKEVGGVLDASGEYRADADPCKSNPFKNTPSSASRLMMIGAGVAILASLFM